MREHTYKPNGAGQCKVCGQEMTKVMTVYGDHGPVYYTVATHPLLINGSGDNDE